MYFDFLNSRRFWDQGTLDSSRFFVLASEDLVKRLVLRSFMLADYWRQALLQNEKETQYQRLSGY